MTFDSAVRPAGCATTQRTTAVLDITVLMGGQSNEREVSLLSGAAIADALDALGHQVTRADINPQDTSALDRAGMDLVFIALHGDFGESGQVQQLCQERSLRFTGSNERASELAMDKVAAKQLTRQAGVTTPDWLVIEEYTDADEVSGALDELGLPVVLKPIDGGSSVDVTIARDLTQRAKALEALLDTYGRALAEAYVPGREFTVGIVGQQAMPVLEIVPDGEFYDYTAKYADDAGTQYRFDHGLDEKTTRQLQQDALTIHNKLGCRDMSRVDFLMDGDDTGRFIEINTIPGFTSHSLLPMAAKQVGLDFNGLIDRLVVQAMQR